MSGKPRFFPFFFKKKKESFPKTRLPRIRTKTLPGPHSAKWLESLKRFEAPGVTYVGDVYPVFFKEAKDSCLTDVDGNRFLDLSACFGAASLGHQPPAVLQAIKTQSRRMIHGLGDVHPNDVKVLLEKKLSEITPGNLHQTLLSSTGAEAVESALKTAVRHTKKTGVIAFEGAYHGLGYGALSVTHRKDFREPFLKQLGAFSYFAPFPDPEALGSKASEISLKRLQSICKKARRSKHPVGAVLLEPIQGRGGIRAFPSEFLKNLRAFCDEAHVLLIADEIFTGFGRTGSMFAMDKSGVVPDLMCLGKGMANGFPISACVGTTRVMFSWGASTGEAIHTSTFLGNPLGCAMALAVIGEIERLRLADRAKTMGDFFRKELWKLKEKYPLMTDIRGSGLMIGVELCETVSSFRSKTKKQTPASDKARRFIGEALREGLVLLTCGADRNVLSLTPPLVIGEKEIQFVLAVFDKIFKRLT